MRQLLILVVILAIAVFISCKIFTPKELPCKHYHTVPYYVVTEEKPKLTMFDQYHETIKRSLPKAIKTEVKRRCTVCGKILEAK